jgi:hypothetical protein
MFAACFRRISRAGVKNKYLAYEKQQLFVDLIAQSRVYFPILFVSDASSKSKHYHGL